MELPEVCPNCDTLIICQDDVVCPVCGSSLIEGSHEM